MKEYVEIKNNRISMEQLESKIKDEQYIKVGKKSVICILTLINNFELIGHSACIMESNFDFDIGKKYAREKAINRLWELESYAAHS